MAAADPPAADLHLDEPTASDLTAHLVAWYDANARDLPWRAPDVTPWGVLVSEVMLQQTPAARVVPAWEQWMTRWPTPRRLADDPPGEAVRAWGRLGYPRRALRLHATAVAVVERHGGAVPADYDELVALPGIGSYTAAAVAAFGFGQRHAVLDTNVRRVLARLLAGAADATASAPTVAERAAALDLVPDLDPARHCIALMELGALVCTTRAPRCQACPVLSSCAWHRAGCPAGGPARRTQTYAGTDRQARGRLLAVVREATESVDAGALDGAWDDAVQRRRALDGLLADGLLEVCEGRYRLPS